MYEHRRQPLLPFPAFVRRMVRHALAVLALMAASLLMGMGGYVYFEHLGWLDAFLNAAMLLGGMGPLAPLTTPGGKLFAGLYALYAGMVFLVGVGVLFAPALHRMLHHFHLAEGRD